MRSHLLCVRCVLTSQLSCCSTTVRQCGAACQPASALTVLLPTAQAYAARRLQRVNTTEADAEEAIKGCTQLVTAVGFQRNQLPEITVDGKLLRDVTYDPHGGAIIQGRLYGAGIAFPEEVIDRELGIREPNVGLLKFMSYARKHLPRQQLCTLAA